MREKSGLQIKKAVQILRQGGVVIFPTDTVYGVGCRIDNEASIKRVYQIKKRNYASPFPILLPDKRDVFLWAEVSGEARELISKFWPGALTVVLPAKKKMLRILKNEEGGASFRVPDSRVIRDLIRAVRVPLLGTSANFHSQDPAKKFEDLDQEFITLGDLVIEGKCKIGMESTVLDLTKDSPQILREGAIEAEEIYDTLNRYGQ